RFKFRLIRQIRIVPFTVDSHALEPFALLVDLCICKFDAFVPEFLDFHAFAVHSFVFLRLLFWRTMIVPTRILRVLMSSHLLLVVSCHRVTEYHAMPIH